MAAKTRRTRRPSARYFVSVQIAGGKETGVMMTDSQRETYHAALLHAIDLANATVGAVARVFEDGILMRVLHHEG